MRFYFVTRVHLAKRIKRGWRENAVPILVAFICAVLWTVALVAMEEYGRLRFAGLAVVGVLRMGPTRPLR